MVEYHIRSKGRSTYRTEGGIGISLRIPTVRYRTDKDVTEIFSRIEKNVLMKTRQDAIDFAREASENMKWHIDQFSRRTVGSGKPHLSGAVTGERLVKGGLRAGVGWEIEQLSYGWSGIAGIGVGIGRARIPLNASKKPYAWFVDKGTNESEGMYVPKRVDIEMFDMLNPTRRIKFHGVNENWTPKFTPGANELQEQWWQASKKRAMLKRGTRKAFGRYKTEPSNFMYTTDFKGRRMAYKPAYPQYDVTSMGFGGLARIGGYPFLGQDITFGRTKFKKKQWVAEFQPVIQGKAGMRKEKAEMDRMLALYRQMSEEQLLETIASNMNLYSSYSLYNVFDKPFGGELRGYGGGHIMLGTGDVAFSIFSLDVRMAIDALGWYNLGMLEGYAGNLGSKVDNEKGLGLRLTNVTGKVRSMGEHPGTVARNFIYNTAQHMMRWLRSPAMRTKRLRSRTRRR